MLLIIGGNSNKISVGANSMLIRFGLDCNEIQKEFISPDYECAFTLTWSSLHVRRLQLTFIRCSLVLLRFCLDLPDSSRIEST